MMRYRELFRSQSGATRLEVIVLVILLSLLAGWLLHTMRFYQELTEKTVVENSILNLRSGLRFRVADLIIRGEAEKQAALARTNPVLLAERPPAGYFGEVRGPGNLPPGSWYYEQDRAELVYIPKLHSHLLVTDSRQPESPVLRWQIRPGGGGGAGVVVDIELLTPYDWF